MILLVDMGNSRMKWALSSDGHWDGGHSAAMNDDYSTLFSESWCDLPTLKQMVVCNVRGPAAEIALNAWCRQSKRAAPWYLRPSRSLCGITNTYHDPSQLGADRWAALVGARSMCTGAAVIIDCGTATTVDVLSHDDVFLGGAILPGLRLARESLLRDTEGISEGRSTLGSLLGRSTAECVSSGVHYGVAGGVDRLIWEIAQTLKQPLTLYITGGDAPRIGPLLKRSAILEPELVLKGLAEIVKRSS